MNDLVFMEISHEIKALHNGALEKIRSGELEEAADYYRKCLQITELISYHEGSAMTLFSMANLELLSRKFPKAIEKAEMARDRFLKATLATDECDALLSRLAVAAKTRGVELERSRRFAEAIDHFEAAIPHADEASSKAMQHEAALLRRIMHERVATDSGRAPAA